MSNKKNIHVLPTDKPSRLSINCQTNLLQLGLENRMFHDDINIYITSDEEIKEGDWCLYNKNHNSRNPNWELVKCGVIEREEMHPISDGRLLLWMTKIVLTTDQDLIKDGVQAIHEEFLEWFVDNPTCEWATIAITNEIDAFMNNKEFHYELLVPKTQIISSTEDAEVLSNAIQNPPKPNEKLIVAQQNALVLQGNDASDFLNRKFDGRGIEVRVFNWTTNEVNGYSPTKLLDEYVQFKQCLLFDEKTVASLCEWAFSFHRREDLSDEELEQEFNKQLTAKLTQHAKR